MAPALICRQFGQAESTGQGTSSAPTMSALSVCQGCAREVPYTRVSGRLGSSPMSCITVSNTIDRVVRDRAFCAQKQ